MSKVSVIVPMYNCEDTIERCVYSIMKQTLDDIEIILVDDGSSDGTKAKAMMLAEKDERICVASMKKNSGTGAAINYGISIASGEYIGEVDCDDTISSSMYEMLYNEAKGADICKGSYGVQFNNMYFPIKLPQFIFPNLDGHIVNKREAFNLHRLDSRKKFLWLGYQPSFWSAIYKREFISQIKWNETPGAAFQDTSVIFRANMLAKRIVAVNYDVYTWWRHDGEATMSDTKYPFAIIDEYKSMWEFIEDTDHDRDEEQILCKMMFSAFLWNYKRLNAELGKQFMDKAAAVLNEHRLDVSEEFFVPAETRIYKLWSGNPGLLGMLMEDDYDKGTIEGCIYH